MCACELRPVYIPTVFHKVSNLCPKYTADDFTIVKLNGNYKVFANRDFPKGTIMLSPDSNEIKDRHSTKLSCAWATQPNSSICIYFTVQNVI